MKTFHRFSEKIIRLRSCLIVGACLSGAIAIGAMLDRALGLPHPRIYNFENLNEGLLEGQDGWPNPKSASDMARRNLSIARGTGRNRSLVLVRSAEGPDVVRQQDRKFHFDPIMGTERDAIMQYDIRVGNRKYDSYFSTGGEMFGIGNGAFSILRGGSLTTPSILPKSVRVGDWLRLRLYVDFKAFNGAGAATLEFANLSRGDLMFQAVPALTQVKLFGARPTWRPPWAHLRVNMRSPPDGFALDNLVPNLNSSSYLAEKLLIVALLSLLGCGAGAGLLNRNR